jgi:hypothetical protein
MGWVPRAGPARHALSGPDPRVYSDQKNAMSTPHDHQRDGLFRGLVTPGDTARGRLSGECYGTRSPYAGRTILGPPPPPPPLGAGYLLPPLPVGGGRQRRGSTRSALPLLPRPPLGRV